MARRIRKITPLDRLRVKAPDNVTGEQSEAIEPYGGSINSHGVPIDPPGTIGGAQIIDDEEYGDIAALFVQRPRRQPWHLNVEDRSILSAPIASISPDAPASRRVVLNALELERTDELSISQAVILKSKGPNHFLRLLRGYGRNIRESTGRDLFFVYMNERTEDRMRTAFANRKDVIPNDRSGTICGCIVRRDLNLKLGEFYATVG